jgi:nucleoid DNA-binding protein
VNLLARRRKLLLPEAEQVMDRFKEEIAQELGLADKVAQRGWGEMTTRECGMVGGMMVKKMLEMAEEQMDNSR